VLHVCTRVAFVLLRGWFGVVSLQSLHFISLSGRCTHRPLQPKVQHLSCRWPNLFCAHLRPLYCALIITQRAATHGRVAFAMCARCRIAQPTRPNQHSLAWEGDEQAQPTNRFTTAALWQNVSFPRACVRVYNSSLRVVVFPPPPTGEMCTVFLLRVSFQAGVVARGFLVRKGFAFLLYTGAGEVQVGGGGDIQPPNRLHKNLDHAKLTLFCVVVGCRLTFVVFAG